MRAIILLMVLAFAVLLPASPITEALSWSTPTLVPTGSTLKSSPAATQDLQNNIWFFWDDARFIYYRIFFSNNNSWSPSDIRFSQGVEPDVSPSPITLANGAIMLFWAAQRSGTWNIHYATYNNGWSAETRLTTDPSPEAKPHAMVDSSGRIWVAWSRIEAGDQRLRFVDSNSNSRWEVRESVVYDNNSNSVYDSGDTAVFGAPPPTGTSLHNDSRIKFADPNTNGNWDTVETLLYDPDLDGTYNPKIRFVDSNNDRVWGQGEAVVYDRNSDGLHSSDETVIVGPAPTPGTATRQDLKIRFVDSDKNGLWTTGDAVVYDTDSSGTYETGEPMILGGLLKADQKLTIVDLDDDNKWDPGETVVYDSNTNRKYDARLKFWDLNLNTVWDNGETVVDDSNLDGLYEENETVVAGELPFFGEIVRSDRKIRFVDPNADGLWEVGESVVYDSNLSGTYDNGEALIAGTTPLPGTPIIVGPGEQVIAGSVPSIGDSLKVDFALKLIDSNGDNRWNMGEAVVYDINSNNIYDVGETVVAGSPFPATGTILESDEFPISVRPPVLGAPLIGDAGLMFVDSNSDGVLNIVNGVVQESVVYDEDSTRNYNLGEPVVAGLTPPDGATLRTDSRIKFSDSSLDGFWEDGEPVVYSIDNAYDSGDTVIGSVTRGARLKTDLNLFYQVRTGATWSGENALSYSSEDETGVSLVHTKDRKVWAVWAQNNSIRLKSFDGNNWSSDSVIAQGSVGETEPSIALDRNGTMWIIWTRLISTGGGTFQADLYQSTSIDNGLSWSAASPLTSTGENELTPATYQFRDKRLWTFFLKSGPSGVDFFYIRSTPIDPVHDVRVDSLTVQPLDPRSGTAVSIVATITNLGDSTETVTVTIMANSTLLLEVVRTLSVGGTEQVVHEWDTSLGTGRYVITVNAGIAGETIGNLPDNLASSQVFVYPQGDVNRDCVTNVADMAMVGSSFGTSAGNPGYNAAADLNGDGVINVVDLSNVGGGFGQSCS